MKEKNKLLTLILCILLGDFGIHDLYLGNKNKFYFHLITIFAPAIILAITNITGFIWILIALSIYRTFTMIDFILIYRGLIKDSEGKDLV